MRRMVPIVGIDPGGFDATIYRGWRDPAYPQDDIIPAQWEAGTNAEKQTLSISALVVPLDAKGTGASATAARVAYCPYGPPDDET